MILCGGRKEKYLIIKNSSFEYLLISIELRSDPKSSIKFLVNFIKAERRSKDTLSAIMNVTTF
jgi:hypothetical protein